MSENLDSYQSYSKRLGSRFTEDDYFSQTCPPGETGRYLRDRSAKEHRESVDRQPRYVNYSGVRQTAHSAEDLLSSSSVLSQVQAKKVAPKKPERKKLNKSQGESSNMDYLLQEQMKLEKELKELQKIREQLVPPLDLHELNTNHVDGPAIAKYDEQYLGHKPLSVSSPRSTSQNKRSPNSKDLKVSPISAGHLISGPVHSTARPELTSGDSMDREVEGLLRELLFSGDSDDDTSPLKREHLSPEIETHIPVTNGTQHSSPRLMVNGYHNGAHDPNVTNGYNESYYTPPQHTATDGYNESYYTPPQHTATNGYIESYSTPPQYTPQFASTQRNHAAPHAVSQDKVGQFCVLKKQEMYWMNRVRHQRQILAQPLDTVVRHEVEEQYFYAQEELCRIEKASADLCQHLTPIDVQWLIKNGMAPSGPEYVRSPRNLHALQTNKHESPSPLYDNLDQRFLLQHQQQQRQQQLQQVPYPAVPGPAVNGMNMPQRLGHHSGLPQPQFSTNVPSPFMQNAGNIFPGYKDASVNNGNVSRQPQANTNASNLSFTKPSCTDKETQTFNEVHVQNGLTNGHRLDRNLETLASDNSSRDSRGQNTRTRDMGIQRVDQNRSTRQPQEPRNHKLRIEADDSQNYPADNAGLVAGAAHVSHLVSRQQGENTNGELAREGTANEEMQNSTHGRQKPAAVKQPSFDDHEVVKLKEKLEHEQKELRDSVTREQMKFLEEQRRLKEEEERQSAWMAEQENQRRIRESLALKAREAQARLEERSADKVRNCIDTRAQLHKT